MPRRKKPERGNPTHFPYNFFFTKKNCELWLSSQIFVSALRDRLSPPTGPQKSIYLRITSSGKRRRREATQCPPFFFFLCWEIVNICQTESGGQWEWEEEEYLFFFFGDIDGLWTGRWNFSLDIPTAPPASFPTKMHTFFERTICVKTKNL